MSNGDQEPKPGADAAPESAPQASPQGGEAQPAADGAAAAEAGQEAPEADLEKGLASAHPEVAPAASEGPACVAVLETAYVGDVVMTSVLARSLKRALPNAKVLLIARPGPAQMAKGLGFHGAIEFDKKGKHAGLDGIDRLARRLQRKGVDTLLVPHRSARSAMLAWRSKLPVRIGYAGKLLGIPFSARLVRYAYTDLVPLDAKLSFTARLLSLLAPLKVPPSEPEPRFRTSIEAKKVVSDLLIRSDAGRADLAVLVPGSVWATKRWPVEHFAKLSDLLADRGLVSVIVGASDERPLLRSIQKRVASRDQLVNGVGTSLDEAAELMRRAKVVVAGDTGLLHLGMAVGTKAVALFGPTDPKRHDLPRGVKVLTVDLPCRPCSEHGPEQCPEQHHRCLRDLEPERVAETVRKLLAPKKRKSKAAKAAGGAKDQGEGAAPGADPAAASPDVGSAADAPGEVAGGPQGPGEPGAGT